MPSKLAKVMRVLLPSGLRVPSLIMRMMTSGTTRYSTTDNCSRSLLFSARKCSTSCLKVIAELRHTLSRATVNSHRA